MQMGKYRGQTRGTKNFSQKIMGGGGEETPFRGLYLHNISNVSYKQKIFGFKYM